MPKNNDIVIDNFPQGIADSDYQGFSDMRLVDITSVPGIAKINFLTTKKTGTTVTDTPQWTAYDAANNVIYKIGDTTKVYKSTDAGATWSLVSGNTTGDANVGLVVYKDWLLAFRASALDAYGPLSSSPSWHNSALSYTTSGVKPAIWGQDDICYFGVKNTVYSLAEKTGQTFDPTNSATYTYTQPALTLPANYTVFCFTELGQSLMIGTFRGVMYQYKVADIFPWDRTSTSFKLPIHVNDFGVTQMITINNLIYFTCGTQGNIYVTNGAYTKLLKQLYKAMAHTSATITPQTLPGAIMQHKGKLYIGVSAGAPSGVWSLDLDTNVLNFEHKISTGTVSNNVTIGTLFPTGNESYLIGWNDADTAAHGIDLVDTTARYTSYAAYIDSGMFRVGTPLNKRTLTETDITLARPLATGQGVKLYYRTSSADSFTLFATFDFATFSSLQSITMSGDLLNAALPTTDNIEIRAALTTGSSSTTTPELREIRLR